MFCPDCQTQLNTIEVIDDYSQGFEIDHCANCGGFWFDKNELYQVPVRVGQDIDYPVGPKTLSGRLNCPREGTRLDEFKDPNIPPALTLYRCPDCSGIFLFKGQLYAYKEYQKLKNLKSVEASKKAAVLVMSFLGFCFLALVGIVFSGNIIKADPVTYNAYSPVLIGFRDIFSFLTIVTFLLLIILEAIYYSKRRKK